MKKIFALFAVLTCSDVMNAQIPVIGTIISEVVKKFDIQIQRLQNEILWMQNVQKNIENNLHQQKLNEIRDWTEKQKALYQDYFTELQTVNKAVSQFSAIKGVITKQIAIVNEYEQGYALVRSGNYFTPADLQYIEKFYAVLLGSSLSATDQLQAARSVNGTQINDAGRLGIIDSASETIDTILHELRDFNQMITVIVQQKEFARANNTVIKKLYGLQ